MKQVVEQFMQQSGIENTYQGLISDVNNESLEASLILADNDFEGGEEIVALLEKKAAFINSEAAKDLFNKIVADELIKLNKPELLLDYIRWYKFITSDEAVSLMTNTMVGAFYLFAEEVDEFVSTEKEG